MSVARAQAEIDSAEFSEWIAYAQIEPFGESRADLRSAMLCTVTANAHRGKASRPFKVSDFMPQFGPRVRDTAEQMKAKAFQFYQQMKAMRGKGT